MKLRNFVHVLDKQGKPHVFGPKSNVPAWAVEKITNPKVWAADEPEEDVEIAVPDEVADDPQGEPIGEPPRHGKGSSLEAWQAYAKSKGLSDADLEGATRDDLIATVGSRED